MSMSVANVLTAHPSFSCFLILRKALCLQQDLSHSACKLTDQAFLPHFLFKTALFDPPQIYNPRKGV